MPVTIGGTSYTPPLPIESQVREVIDGVIQSDKEVIDKAVELCMYCMRTQIFLDGNKRASVIFANHYMIAHGLGMMVIPKEYVTAFKKQLVEYYESGNIGKISGFLKEKCWRRL